MSSRHTLRASSCLASGAIAAVLLLAPQVGWAQEGAAPVQGEVSGQALPADGDTADVGDIIVTGSRIPVNEFTSASPVQVLTTARAEQRGLADTAQFLQSSTIASGSPQVTSAISSSFVTDGGPGASTISLRGLGANRTLVLLNGRRAGPAGTRGGVSSFDLNVIPQSALSRVDILKDGASSIYGSDAVAGVVNLVSNPNPNGGEMSVFATSPFEGGGEQYDISGSYGKSFSRGHFNISGDIYHQEMLREGDRDYLTCTNQYVFDAQTGARADRIDPRTGKPQCLDTLWGQVYVYGPDFSGRSGRFQYDYDGNLGNYIPTRPTDPATSAMYPNAPAGFYLVNYDAASRAVVNARHPFADKQSIIPETDRYTVFAEGSFDITSNIEAYSEVLLNRRESRTDSYRQFWNYTYTADFGGDPVTGFTGPNFLSATPITDHFDQSQTVDYGRIVLGLRGDLNGGFLNGWKWDVFAQYSRSDGDYTSDVLLQDAVDSTSFKYQSCVGDTLPVSGRQCIDMDFTDPRVLRGDLTQAEQDFLYDTETGNTLYEQTYVEGFIGGELFDLPAGPLGVALGFHLRRDEIKDVPGEVTLANNSWGLTGAGITEGSEETREIYAEVQAPLLRDAPFARELTINVSGRYTDTKTSGDASTYKIGLNWEVIDGVRFRATRGTSFRAPALFELYLADQTSFASQRSIDPCLNLNTRLADGTVTQELYNNCTSPSGPVGGVDPDYAGAPSSATVITGGGLGNLEAETSESTVLGVVLTPPDSGLSLALDYFEIEINGEVTALGGAGILQACYLSDNFPNDPVCNQFDRDPTSYRIVNVRDQFINIASQENRGIDFTARYITDTPWGELTLDSQTTWTLEDRTALFADFFTDPNGQIGNPELVGNINASFNRGPWTVFWGFDWIGSQSNTTEFTLDNGGPYLTLDGRQVTAKTEAEFTGFHSASVAYDFDRIRISAGVANIFDEMPPAVSSVAGVSNVLGNSVFTSQYTEAYYGRRGFVRVSAKF